MKKLISLLLALVFVLSLFAGCAKTDEPADAPAADKPTDAPATNEPAAETSDWKEEHPTWLCEEKTTLTIMTMDTDASSVLPVSNDLEFWKFLEEYTNVHIEWNTIPNADYGEVVQARMAAGEFMGDIVNVHNNLDNLYTGGQNGLFIDMGPYYETCFPYTRAWMEENNVNMERHWVNPDGSMYGITSIYNAQQNHVMGLWNTAWLEKLGLEVPDTLDEFTDVLYAMKEAGDLNENGEDDEVIITTVDFSLIFDLFNSAFGVEISNRDNPACYSVDENGNVFFVPSSENAKAMYTYMNQLYNDGILDPEIFSHSWDWDKISERAANERAGVMILWSSFAPVYGKLTARGIEDPMSENYSISMALKSEYNSNNPTILADSTTGYGFAVSAESEHQELAMRWLDVVMAEPTVLEFRCWGVEGEDYEVVDGKNQLILPEDGSSWNIAHRGCGQVVVPHIQTNDQLVNPDSAYTWYVEDYAAYLASGTIAESKLPGVSAYTDEERELIDMYSTDIADYVNEMRAKFVTGELDIEKDWADYCATLESLGVNELAVAYESIYTRLQ